MNQVCSEIGSWSRVFKSVKCKCSCAKKRQQTYSGIDESCFGDKIKRSWSATNARNFLEIDLWFRKFGIMSDGSVHLPVHAPSCGSPRVSCGLHIGISTSQGVHGFKALYGLFDPTNTILSLWKADSINEQTPAIRQSRKSM